MTIAGFFKEYRFLSNFFMAETSYDGEIYPSSEHAYAAAKTLDLYEREVIRDAETPKEAKKLGRSVKIRKDWDEIKVAIMRQIVLDKFTRNRHLIITLIETQDEVLIEENYWKDTFWGEYNGVGENNLGKILMEIRELFYIITSEAIDASIEDEI